MKKEIKINKANEYLRDGPLGKLLGGGRGGGGGEFFSRRKLFFRHQITCMNFFRPLHEHFLGLIGVHDFFFHLIFRCVNTFLYSIKFSNVSSLNYMIRCWHKCGSSFFNFPLCSVAFVLFSGKNEHNPSLLLTV